METGAFFDRIIGHEKAKRLLDLALAKPQHGYVITGPDGVGVHPIAEAFVRRLADEYNGESLSAHPDILILKREESEKGTGLKKVISVEAVREFRHRVSERPTIASRLVVYIPDADYLNEEGVNSLLKCIEDPAVSIVYVFVAHAVGKLPATLLSRLREIRLDRVATSKIASWLVEQGMSTLEAKTIAEASDGRPGYAHRYLTDQEERFRMEASDHAIDEMMRANSAGALIAPIATMASGCDGADDPVAEWRKALQLWQASLRRTERTSPARFHVIGQALIMAERSLGTSIPPRIWLEYALVSGFRNEGRVKSRLIPHAFPFLPERVESQ